MKEQRHIKIYKDAQVLDRIIEFSTSEPWELRLLNENSSTFEYTCSASDLFECLTILRKNHLEKINCLIMCNGARMDVYPSRMSRQMSGGKKAYIMHLGKPARRQDLVDIFEPVDDYSLISTVTKQKQYFKKWLDSLS